MKPPEIEVSLLGLKAALLVIVLAVGAGGLWLWFPLRGQPVQAAAPAATATPVPAETRAVEPATPSVLPTKVATTTPVPTLAPDVKTGVEILGAFCHGVPFEDWQAVADHLLLTTDLSGSVQEKLDVAFRAGCKYDPSNDPQSIVIHYTRGDSLEGAVAALRTPKGPSIHYVIDRDGTVAQILPESLAASHVSCSADLPDCPALRSIGIELVNRGQVNLEYFQGPTFEDYQMSFGWRYWEEYPDAQVEALKLVVTDVAARWEIPLDPAHVFGHYRVNQKADPGPALNLFWERYGDPVRPAIFEAVP